ncbi:MAG: Gfo/Idh/MocA family oxidoreductase [Acidobacteria bacterium]|nr:Gfo/Idh/MocA family oxidoreductase [Acidobacteriota bacterium]
MADTTRRTIFKAASAAVATAQFPILGANDRVNLGQVGIGGRGRDHLNYYAAIEEARIAAVCDVNQAGRERGAAQVQKLKGYAPAQFADMRTMFESKDIDAVSVTTPNHWHALSTIWACQAGKDVYVEKPASHNVFEGAQMVAAARKYKRMVQVGSQSRTIAHKMRAMELLREGVIGHVYHSRGLCYRRRFSIGHTPDEPVPPGLDWDGFLGPAQMRPYTKNRFAYNWHWFWDTGNGDIGNQGIHEMDIALWGLGRGGWPKSVVSTGSKYVWKDDQETANTQSASFEFGDAMLTFEVRNLPTPTEGGAPIRPNSTGNIFFGELGFMYVDNVGFQVYKSAAASLSHESVSSASAGGQEKYQQVMDEKATEGQAWATTPHMRNFVEAVKSRDYRKLNADIAIGARSAAFVHLANISLRVGRRLTVRQADGRFAGDDEANSMLTRDYRDPFVIGSQI